MTIGRIAFFGGAGRWSLGSLFLVVILASVAGAVAGLGFGLLRGLQKYGALGRWLRWTLAIIIYGAAVVAAIAPFEPKAADIVRTESGWVILVGLATVYGAAIAYFTRPEA
jgi:hypothetical protein